MRDDISMIDGASAILSAGGGKSFSVRSSKVSKMSMLTPVTNMSAATSVFESRKSDFVSTQHSSPKSIVKSLHNYSKAQNKLIQSENKRLETNPDGVSEQPSGLSSDSKQKSIPYPYLQGFINDASAASKRTVFDYTGFDDMKASLQA